MAGAVTRTDLSETGKTDIALFVMSCDGEGGGAKGVHK